MKTQKRLAASLLKVGVNKVRINPEDEEAVMALTRQDIRDAIARGAIYKLPPSSISRYRARQRKIARKKGRSSGHGKRKGPKTARTSSKKTWIRQIRGVRKTLREMRGKKELSRSEYRKLYRHSKAGIYRTKSQVKSAGGK